MQEKRIIYILSGSAFFLSVGYTMLIPFLPVYLLELGADEHTVAVWSGFVFSITFFIAGIMAPIWGKLADKKGKKRMVIRAGIALGFCYAFAGMVQNEWQLFFARGLMGFANGFVPAAMTLLSTSVNQKEVGVALSKFQMGLILGNVVGPFMGGLISQLVGMRPAFYVVGIVLFIITFVVYRWIPEPIVENEEEAEATKSTSFWQDVEEVRTNAPFMMLAMTAFLVQAALLMIQPIFALYVGQFLGSMEKAAVMAGSMLSASGIVAFFLAPWWAKFGQKNGYFKAVVCCLFGSGVMFYFQALAPNVWIFALSQVMLAVFGVGTMPSINAAVTEHTSAATRGRAFGVMTMAQQFGSMVGPLFASLLSVSVGFSAVFFSTGTVLLIVSMWMRRRVKQLIIG